jgi:uncharacterized protein YndB with AHSA1/START domain
VPGTERSVSVSRHIAAPAEAIFAVLADPARHPEIDGSGTVRVARPRGPSRLSLGARFQMDMRLGLPYRITNVVVEFEEGRRIAWRHWGRHVWRYTLEPTGTGTTVTETFDWSRALSPAYVELFGWPRRHLPAMEATLARLEDVVRRDLSPG